MLPNGMVRTDKAELGGLPAFLLTGHSCRLCYRPGVGLQSLLRHPHRPTMDRWVSKIMMERGKGV